MIHFPVFPDHNYRLKETVDIPGMAVNQFTQVVVNFSMIRGTELIINRAADKDQRDDGNDDDDQDDIPV